MTEDDIQNIYIASHSLVKDENGFECLHFSKNKFARLVAAFEREACAQVCEEHPDGLNMMGGAFVACAKAIRARGEA